MVVCGRRSLKLDMSKGEDLVFRRTGMNYESFMSLGFLGGMMSEDGWREAEAERRVIQGRKKWR